MVSVLALNRWSEGDDQHGDGGNPCSEEAKRRSHHYDNTATRPSEAENRKAPGEKEANPFDEFDVGSFFNQYLGPAEMAGIART